MDSSLPFAILRMLDANMNRASEGLRTLEDLARFSLDNVALCSAYKHLRHELTNIVSQSVGADRYLARNTPQDVGTEVSSDSEYRRDSISSIACAAASRVEQSLRCIEECLKLESVEQAPSAATCVEQLRYRAYTANSQLLLILQRDQEFLKNARLYVLVSCELSEAEFVTRVKSISQAGADLIQIRDKSAESTVIMQRIKTLCNEIDLEKTKVIVNDRVDLATLSDSHGVHLGQTDITPALARRLLKPKQWLGVSTHNRQQLVDALHDNVDYVGCGPTFSSQTKSFDTFAGLDFLREASQLATCPAFAIGGIKLDNVAQVRDAGVDRIAVSGAIWSAANPVDATKRFVDILRN